MLCLCGAIWPRIRPGDRIRTDAMLFDYRLTETKFGGPTLFSRGDTSFFNQNGEALGKLRSTSIRYHPDNARRLNALAEQQGQPQWTAQQLERNRRARAVERAGDAAHR